MAISLASEAANRPLGGLWRSLHRAGISALAGVILVVVAASAAAKAFAVADTSWEGTSEFYALAQDILGKARVEVVASIDFATLSKDDGLLILHPEVDLDYNELSAFLRAGGRMAVLDDHGEAAHFLARFQIRRVEAPRHPAQSLRDNPDLAIAVPAVEQVAGQEQNRHPVVAGVDRVVTNHPTALVHPNLTQVLKIPALGEPDATLAVTGIIAKSGRLFAMGDPSVLINEMLRYPGNRAFASGLVKYLVENDAGISRGGKLYVVANDFEQRGHFGGSRGALGELSSLSDTLTNFVSDLTKNGLPGALALGLAVLACAGVLLWATTYSVKLYRRSMPRYALAPPLAAQGGLAGRAAVLAAPTTDPVLLVLELRSALSDALCHRLGLVRLSSPEQILNELSRNRVLGSERIAEVNGLFQEFSRAQASLLSRKRLKMAGDRLAQLSRKVLEILAEIEQRNPR
ncbi:MAG TPA: DUF4350 domain-containing protein [Polyangiaceae bacterium]|jgi:hypothetical protein|nr:DUF4350 domain-containing protein [Polyangiaceae bacterium]